MANNITSAYLRATYSQLQVSLFTELTDVTFLY